MGRILFVPCTVALLLLSNAGCQQESRPTAETEPTPKAEPIVIESDVEPIAAEPPAVQHVPDSRPIAVVLEDCGEPVVIVYEGGDIIYVRDRQQYPWRYYFTKLMPDEMGEMLATLNSFGDYLRLERYYDVAPFTCIEDRGTEFFLAFGEKTVVTQLEGLGIGNPRDAPKVLWSLYRYLTGLDFDDAQPWLPPTIRVSMGPSYAKESKPSQWPSDWPGPTSPDAEKLGVGYLVRLPGNQLSRLENLLDGRRVGEVNIAQSVCYGFDFPGEDIWGRALWPHKYEATEGEGIAAPEEPDEGTTEGGSSPQVGRVVLDRLDGRNDLTRLDLSGSEVTDAELEHLQRLT